MGNNQTYKNRALQSLEGKWSNGIIAALIVFLIDGGISYVSTAPFEPTVGFGITSVWTLLCLPLEWGLCIYFLRLIRNLDISYERLFDGYKDFVRIFLAMFLANLCAAFATLLLIVPGIIVALMLSQTAFILKDDPTISAADAMKKSAAMMNGHKAKLFWLYLSFIGWAILSLLTLGLGFLMLVPYASTTLAHFYEDLKAEYEGQAVVTV